MTFTSEERAVKKGRTQVYVKFSFTLAWYEAVQLAAVHQVKPVYLEGCSVMPPVLASDHHRFVFRSTQV